MNELAVTIKGTDPALLRRIRALAVLGTLRRAGPLALTPLASQSGLSRPVTQTVVDELVATGWIDTAPDDTAADTVRSVGRPARLFRFRSEAGHVAGIDIGAHSVSAVVCDLDGTLRARSRATVSPGDRADARLKAARAAIAKAAQDAGVEPRELWSVGLATTGVVDHSGRVVKSVALPEWAGLDLGAAFADTVPGPLRVENDCRAAALAERWQGAAQGTDDLVYIHAGLRTGAGVLVGGRPLRGYSGAAGEIGAMSALGWAEAPMHLIGLPGLEAGIAPEDVAERVFARARAGDPLAQAAVERFSTALAQGIVALCLTFDPQLVVLGGGISRSADIVLGHITRELARVCIRVPDVVASALDREAVVLGAVRIALDMVDERFFDPRVAEPLAPPPARR
ncbi:ROK family transcriptional regulator [Streptomyces sp. NPDC047017]|uniref:ROK family transcriptional regulator n=1 Tax=Streptomyces sp. NPDC047017 TaxID=3155024 RepID=UPI0033F5B060